ncbi:hypothetical protein F4776DRAFT_607732 [Hypoxylon sp. NC0597]|nr:hypothetical protein F4776DRAFT_607732 [Hypoxylon sp. NC0597]
MALCTLLQVVAVTEIAGLYINAFSKNICHYLTLGENTSLLVGIITCTIMPITQVFTTHSLPVPHCKYPFELEGYQ